MSASFDDPNLGSAAGLVPIIRLADTAGLPTLAKDRMALPADKGANADAKITTLIAGMITGAGSIDDMDQLRRRHKQVSQAGEHGLIPTISPMNALRGSCGESGNISPASRPRRREC